MMTMGGRLVGLRRSAQLTQRQLAKETKLRQDTISFLERDARTPRLETLQKLAARYGVTVDYILTGAGGA